MGPNTVVDVEIIIVALLVKGDKDEGGWTTLHCQRQRIVIISGCRAERRERGVTVKETQSRRKDTERKLVFLPHGEKALSSAAGR